MKFYAYFNILSQVLWTQILCIPGNSDLDFWQPDFKNDRETAIIVKNLKAVGEMEIIECKPFPS